MSNITGEDEEDGDTTLWGKTGCMKGTLGNKNTEVDYGQTTESSE